MEWCNARASESIRNANTGRKAFGAGVRPEVVIKAAILLHDENEMLDLLETRRSGRRRGCLGGRAISNQEQRQDYRQEGEARAETLTHSLNILVPVSAVSPLDSGDPLFKGCSCGFDSDHVPTDPKGRGSVLSPIIRSDLDLRVGRRIVRETVAADAGLD